jgi:hypothetical protein
MIWLDTNLSNEAARTVRRDRPFAPAEAISSKPAHFHTGSGVGQGERRENLALVAPVGRRPNHLAKL